MSLQTAETLTSRQIAARKAWDTMRARKALLSTMAAVAVEAPRPPAPVAVHVTRFTDADLILHCYREPELEPVTEFQFVTINLTDSDVGSGQREFIVLDMSSTKVRLFYPPSLETIIVHRQTFDRGNKPVSNRRYNRKRMIDRIRGRIALADQVNGDALEMKLSDGGADAQRAVMLLSGH